MEKLIEKDLLALPCVLCGKPLFESQDGFRVYSAIVNDSSKSFNTVKEQLPYAWRTPANYRKGDFIVCVNSDYPLFSEVPYIFMGEIVNHKKYGQQFKAYDFCTDDPSDIVMMEQYLTRLPNVKEKRARMIIEAFDVSEIQKIIETDLQRLVDAISGINMPRALEIQKQWFKDKTVRDVYMWLLAHGVSAIYGKKILEQFSEKTIEILESNPYSLTDIRGIGFQKADEIAHKILKVIPKELRAKSCLLYVLHDKEDFGHVCYPVMGLKNETCNILSERDKDTDYGNIVMDIIKKDLVLLGDKESQIAFAYLPSMFLKERDCAKFLADFSKLSSPYSDIATDREVDDAEAECSVSLDIPNLEFDTNQRLAIKSAFLNKLTVLTGGGGTGKSTICRAICTMAKNNGLGLTLLAPTGQAAQVLTNKTSVKASTIHRGLGLLPAGKREVELNPMAENTTIRSAILIIDEFSMVGTDLLPYVFDAITNPEVTNIILVGDPQQLPSVSPGNNLHDIIKCGCASVVKLEKIYRQSEKSYITIMADEIAHGKIPGIPKESDDFFWIDMYDPEEALETVKKILTPFKENGNVDDVQVIASIYDRKCGVNSINSMCQDLLTKSDNFIVHEQRIFYLKDRVMQIKNNYQKSIFNGNTGYIIDLGYDVLRPEETDSKRYYIEVKFDGDEKSRVYEEDEISELRVAWCSTVHKFQGAQKKHVIFLMMSDHRNMMYRELVYTAFTRAEKGLYVIGATDMLESASRRSIIASRYTNLQSMFKNFVSGEDLFKLKLPESLPKLKEAEALEQDTLNIRSSQQASHVFC